jgi:hypothetical protein
MATNSSFRQLAISLHGVTESPHFEKTSFRINNKIFATPDTTNHCACLKLSLINQSVFCAFEKSVIYPVDNKLGQQGWTLVNLATIKKGMLKDITMQAYNEVVSTKVKKK